MNSTIKTAIVAGLLIVMGSQVSRRVLAQEPSARNDVGPKKVTLNLENADIRYALKLVFQSAGIDYTLDAGVQGTVTAALTDVPFRTALESLLRTAQAQAPLTYRVENGIYNVGLRREEPKEAQVMPPPVEAERKRTKVARIQLNYADPQDITLALGGTMLPSRFAEIAGGMFGGGFGNGGGQGNGMSNGMGGSGIGIVNIGSGGGPLGGNGQSGGNGLGLTGNFGTGFGNGAGAGNGPGGGNGRGRGR